MLLHMCQSRTVGLGLFVDLKNTVFLVFISQFTDLTILTIRKIEMLAKRGGGRTALGTYSWHRRFEDVDDRATRPKIRRLPL